MGFWSFFFGKRTRVEDAFFGEMTFMVVKANPANSYFEGWCHFKPIDEKIEIGLSGRLGGSTQVQRDFFNQIERVYPSLVHRAIPLIESSLQNWQAGFKIDNFKQEFKPVYLFIPECVQKPIEWEISFESMPGLVSQNYPYILTIEMVDYEPLHVSVSQ